MMRDKGFSGGEPTVKQAGIRLARNVRRASIAKRFVATVFDVTDRETTGMVECELIEAGRYINAHVRANVDLAADDQIWVKQDPSAQGNWVFDGFVAGGGTGNNAADAPIPWTQSPGVISPPSSDLTIEAASGQAVNVGAAGQTVTIVGDITGVDAEDITYTPAVAADWDGDADPGDANDALDQLAERVDDIEGGASHPFQVWIIGSKASADYATLAAAMAATPAAGTLLLMDAETHTVDNVTLLDGVHLAGMGVDATKLTTSAGAYCLQVGDASRISDLSVENTYASGDAYAIYMHTNADTAEFRNVRAYASPGAGHNAYAFTLRGDSKLFMCVGDVGTANIGYGVWCIGAGTREIHGGKYDGEGSSGGDDIADQDGDLRLYNPLLVNSKCNTIWGDGASVRGSFITALGQEVSDLNRVLNSAGGAVVAGDVGYIDSDGSFKVTTSAYSDLRWAVIVSGGANGDFVWALERGRVLVELNGNCSAGDYLYTSTTASQAQPQSYVRPELFAVALTANASGAGGTCEALLLCNSRFIPVSSDYDVYFVSSASDYDWRTTVAGVAGAVVTYSTPLSAGAEDTIVPYAGTELGKIRLYNETRGEYALIDTVDTVADTITVTDAADVAAWVATNVITTRSQVCTGAGTEYWDIDLSSAENTVVPILARALWLETLVRDTGAVGQSGMCHPWESYDARKRTIIFNHTASNQYTILSVTMKLIQRRFCVSQNASGASTGSIAFRVRGWWEAAP
jgi:hypothetical protein